jgi:hypothetical protein
MKSIPSTTTTIKLSGKEIISIIESSAKCGAHALTIPGILEVKFGDRPPVVLQGAPAKDFNDVLKSYMDKDMRKDYEENLKKVPPPVVTEVPRSAAQKEIDKVSDQELSDITYLNELQLSDPAAWEREMMDRAEREQ